MTKINIAAVKHSIKMESVNFTLFGIEHDAFISFDERLMGEVNFEKNLAVLGAKLLEEPDLTVRLALCFDRATLNDYHRLAELWLGKVEAQLRGTRTYGIYAGLAISGAAVAVIGESLEASGMPPFFWLIFGSIIFGASIWRHAARIRRQTAAVTLGREIIGLSKKAIEEKTCSEQRESEDELARNTLYLIYQNGIPSMIRSEFYINGEGRQDRDRQMFLPAEATGENQTVWVSGNALTFQKLNSSEEEDSAQRMICDADGIS